MSELQKPSVQPAETAGAQSAPIDVRSDVPPVRSPQDLTRLATHRSAVVDGVKGYTYLGDLLGPQSSRLAEALQKKSDASGTAAAEVHNIEIVEAVVDSRARIAGAQEGLQANLNVTDAALVAGAEYYPEAVAATEADEGRRAALLEKLGGSDVLLSLLTPSEDAAQERESTARRVRDLPTVITGFAERLEKTQVERQEAGTVFTIPDASGDKATVQPPAEYAPPQGATWIDADFGEAEVLPEDVEALLREKGVKRQTVETLLNADVPFHQIGDLVDLRKPTVPERERSMHEVVTVQNIADLYSLAEGDLDRVEQVIEIARERAYVEKGRLRGGGPVNDVLRGILSDLERESNAGGSVSEWIADNFSSESPGYDSKRDWGRTRTDGPRSAVSAAQDRTDAPQAPQSEAEDTPGEAPVESDSPAAMTAPQEAARGKGLVEIKITRDEDVVTASLQDGSNNMQLLKFLAEHPGDGITREEIATFLQSIGARSQASVALNNLKVAIGDKGENPLIQNISVHKQPGVYQLDGVVTFTKGEGMDAGDAAQAVETTGEVTQPAPLIARNPQDPTEFVLRNGDAVTLDDVKARIYLGALGEGEDSAVTRVELAWRTGARSEEQINQIEAQVREALAASGVELVVRYNGGRSMYIQEVGVPLANETQTEPAGEVATDLASPTETRTPEEIRATIASLLPEAQPWDQVSQTVSLGEIMNATGITDPSEVRSILSSVARSLSGEQKVHVGVIPDRHNNFRSPDTQVYVNTPRPIEGSIAVIGDIMINNIGERLQLSPQEYRAMFGLSTVVNSHKIEVVDLDQLSAKLTAFTGVEDSIATLGDPDKAQGYAIRGLKVSVNTAYNPTRPETAQALTILLEGGDQMAARGALGTMRDGTAFTEPRGRSTGFAAVSRSVVSVLNRDAVGIATPEEEATAQKVKEYMDTRGLSTEDLFWQLAGDFDVDAAQNTIDNYVSRIGYKEDAVRELLARPTGAPVDGAITTAEPASVAEQMRRVAEASGTDLASREQIGLAELDTPTEPATTPVDMHPGEQVSIGEPQVEPAEAFTDERIKEELRGYFAQIGKVPGFSVDAKLDDTTSFARIDNQFNKADIPITSEQLRTFANNGWMSYEEVVPKKGWTGGRSGVENRWRAAPKDIATALLLNAYGDKLSDDEKEQVQVHAQTVRNEIAVAQKQTKQAKAKGHAW